MFGKYMTIDSAMSIAAHYRIMQEQSKKSFSLLIGFAAMVCIVVNPAFAVDWRITPTVKAQEIYSDNVGLSAQGSERGALVSELSPGISVIGRSARTVLNLNYQMQTLYNAGGNNGLNISNQLQYNSFNVLARNKLFLTSRSSISQQNLSNSQIAVDNISGSGNRTTVSTFGISPYWTPTLGHYASGRVAVNYDTVNSGTSVSSSSQNSAFSDSNNLGETVQLNSGTRFGRWNWGLLFSNNQIFRSAGDTVTFQNGSATLRPYINKHFNVFFQGGYSNNSFRSTTDSNNNGFFYTVGGKWMPSKHYSLEAGIGNNSFVTVYISPMQRFSWVTTYRDNSIGLNSGQTWQTALNYRTRRSIWSLTHENDTTTTQQILSNIREFNTQDDFGNPADNPQANPSLINLPALTDEVIVRKRWNFSVSFNTGKTTLGVSAYNESRDFQESGNHEKVRGINGNWSFRFAPKTSIYLQPTWQETQRDSGTVLLDGSFIPGASNDQRYDIALGLSQAISRRISGRLEFRHINQSSDISINDYQENRATATMFMRF
jgi:hypothetical protein